MDRRRRGPDGLLLRRGHGAGPAIARFSIAHHITGSAAWTVALVMMALADVLTRLVTVYLRGRRLTGTATPVVVTSVRAMQVLPGMPEGQVVTETRTITNNDSARTRVRSELTGGVGRRRLRRAAPTSLAGAATRMPG